MRTNARRGAHALTMVVLTAAVSLSGRVEAQQTGLFPLAPIRRQRVPCDQEDPTYKVYKHQYFGYHPTCWRTFPPGWGCPSAEAPNREKSFREVKAGNEPEEGSGELPPPEERGAPPARRTPAIPELPPERSPFEELPGANPLPRGGTPPRTPAARPGGDPFQDLNPRGASTTRNRPPTRSAVPSPGDETPELAAPSRQPAQGSASRAARGADDDESTGDDQAPLLGLADADIVRSDTGAADDPPAAPATANSSTAAPAASSTPPRRRLFGNLFSGFGSNWGRP